MQKRLYINGELADLADTPSAISFKYFDITEGIETRYQVFSSGITLPFTARNKSIFKYADVVGASLDNTRGLSNVDLWYGHLKVISGGTLMLESMDANGYHCMINSRNSMIEAMIALTVEDLMDEAATDIGDIGTYKESIDLLKTGSLGVLLARDMYEGRGETGYVTLRRIYYGDFSKHWVWFSIKKLLESIESLCGINILIAEDGDLKPISTSTIATTYFNKLWTPGFIYYLDLRGTPSQVFINKNKSAGLPFQFGDEYMPRSEFRVFGGKTAWDMVKLVAQMFCCGIKTNIKDSSVILFPLSEIKTFRSVDLSGKLTAHPQKIPFINGYTSRSLIRFTTSDNIPKDYNQIVLTSPKLPAEEKIISTLNLLVPGFYYNDLLEENMFRLNCLKNNALQSVPLILYQAGITASVTVKYDETLGSEFERDADLEILRMLDLSPFFAGLQEWLTKGLMYNCEMYLNMFDYMKLEPYRYVNIKELGGDFYLNKIDKWNPDKPARVQLIKVDQSFSQIVPTITWAKPDGLTYGDALTATELGATADVAGTFAYNYAIGDILNAGTHTLTVVFTPYDTYAYKTVSKSVTLVIAKAQSTVTFNDPAAITYGTALGAAQLNATADIAGTFVYTPGPGTILNAGSHTLSVAFVPYDSRNYIGDYDTANITVNKATCVLTWNPPASLKYGTAWGALMTATVNPSPAGTFTYYWLNGAVWTEFISSSVRDAGNYNIRVTFTPTDTSNYNGATQDEELTVTARPAPISWNISHPYLLKGSAMRADILNAESSVAGTFVYRNLGNVISVGDIINPDPTYIPPQSYTITVTFTPTSSNYSEVTAQKTITLFRNFVESNFGSYDVLPGATASVTATNNVETDTKGEMTLDRFVSTSGIPRTASQYMTDSVISLPPGTYYLSFDQGYTVGTFYIKANEVTVVSVSTRSVYNNPIRVSASFTVTSQQYYGISFQSQASASNTITAGRILLTNININDF
jgi:hypothetical protein